MCIGHEFSVIVFVLLSCCFSFVLKLISADSFKEIMPPALNHWGKCCLPMHRIKWDAEGMMANNSQTKKNYIRIIIIVVVRSVIPLF